MSLAYALPASLSLGACALWLGAWRGPRQQAALGLALASAWLPWIPSLGLALASLCLLKGAEQRLGLGLPALLLALLKLRAVMGPLPLPWGFWVPAAFLVLAALSAQGLLAAEDGESAGLRLGLAQASWCAFGLASSAPLGLSGALLLCWQQPLLLRPWAAVVSRAPGRVFLAGVLTLGLAGGPPLSAFNAYFQLLAPLMTEGALVQDGSKLFSGNGLLGILATLALLYQTGALGYFYWARVLPAALGPAEKEAGLRPLPQPWAWACAGLSLAWGLAEHWGWPGRLALDALRAVQALHLP